jgi:polar amino acid transport system ATP-binding protein
VTEAVRVDDVHKSFGPVEVLRGVDLVVDDHEVVCLIGASGSGKSTLLRCIDLLDPVDAGRIWVEGIEITAAGVDQDAVRRRIGIVFQAFNLFPHMTVARNVTLAQEKALGRSASDARATCDELLVRFGLADKAEDYPDRLSGGQQQRVAIARALAMNPAVVVCDEPTSALDVTTQARVLTLLEELQKATGVAYLFISHDLGVVNDISDRIAVLFRGEIVEIGEAKQVALAPRNQYTRELQMAAPIADPKKQRARRRERLALLAAGPHEVGIAPLAPA